MRRSNIIKQDDNYNTIKSCSYLEQLFVVELNPIPRPYVTIAVSRPPVVIV